MEIRPIVPADRREDISRVYEESWKSAYKGIIPQTYLDSIPKGNWVPHIDDPDQHTLICVDGGSIVGTTSFCRSRFEEFSSWGEIISVYLLPEYVGQGYGKSLLREAIIGLRKLGFSNVFLWVLEDNHRARSFYENMGFVSSGNYIENQIGEKTLREVQYTYSIEHHTIRPMDKDETDLLKDFLYEAIFVPDGAGPLPRSIIDRPELRIYTDDFGARQGDNCLVADFGGKVVGAVWTRIMNDYGHVDDDTPSIAISVYEDYRGMGIGTELMEQMLALLKGKGYKQASLSVQKANRAVKMYEKIGFKVVDENEQEYIMVCGS